MKKILKLAVLCGSLAVAACGVKPNDVDPPAGVVRDDFPRIYPDPATDPKP